MAKFCKICGTPLEEGQVCACQSQQQQQYQPQQQPYPGQQYQPQQQYAQPQQQYEQMQYQQQYVEPNMQYQGQPQYVVTMAPAQPSSVGIYFKRMWSLIKGLVKAPVSVGSQFVNACDFKLSFSLIGVQTLAVALLLISLAGKINITMSSASGGIAPDGAKFPLLSIFIVGSIVTYGIACLLPAVLLMFSKLFKCNTTYKYMLCASGISSIMATPFILVGVLISLIMPLSITAATVTNPMAIVGPFIWPLAISFIGVGLGNFTTIKIIHAGSDLTDDKSVYVMFFTGIVLTIALVIVFTIVVPFCIPPLLKSALDTAGGLGGFLG